MKKILILAFLLRILVSLLGWHGDVVNYYWWSKDLLNRGFLGFYDREIVNAMRPTYPPVTSYVFWMSANLHEIVWKISWFLNINISIFPSNFILWLESPPGWYFFNKLPAIFADLGIIAILYYFVSSFGSKKKGRIAAAIFAFTPVFWYNSSLWGQTDSIYGLTLLTAFFAQLKKRSYLSIFLYTISLLTKPTAIFAFPIFLIWWFRSLKFKKFFISIIIIFSTILILYFPFHPQNLLSWIFTFYKKSLGGELNYLVANSFNFWGLIFGFDNRIETTLFLGIRANIFGYLIWTLISTIFILYLIKQKVVKVTKVLLLSVLFSFATFLFLPRMHERYFYPTLLLFVPLASNSRRFLNLFWLASFIHLVNLYHFWWFPKVPILVAFFSDPLVIKLLIIFNFAIFFLLIGKLREGRIHS